MSDSRSPDDPAGDPTSQPARGRLRDNAVAPALPRSVRVGKRYHYPGDTDETSALDALKWAVTRRPARWPSGLGNPPADPVLPRVTGDRCRVTFINHATVLVQGGGVNLLTDPVFFRRASPVRFAGPPRHRPAGLTLDALPPIDAVLVSHNHYDHLDVRSLARLQAMHAPLVITPLGNAPIIAAADGTAATELDWWEAMQLAEQVSVTLVPSRHWSSRRLGDANHALWGGFVMHLPGGNIYFAGDTGYADGSHFVAARQALGPFRLALLPIGAYEPRWFMRPQHMNPAEAVQAFDDLGCAWAMGIHFGTFRLTDEAHDAPVRDLASALAQRDLDPGRFRALANGQAWDVPGLV